MKKAFVIACLALFGTALVGEQAEARGRHIGFRTGHCKRASCFAKHPGGSYVHPIHARGRRRH